MRRSPYVRVQIDLRRVRRNVEEVRARTGVPVIAVIKADAYGLGADRVAPAIADLVDSFCVFSPDEAKAIDLWRRTGKSALAIGPPLWDDPQDYLAEHVQPAVSSLAEARHYRDANPIICVDTGQQRFACQPGNVAALFHEAQLDEAFTHAVNLEQVRIFCEAVEGRVRRMHAAGSSLLDEPIARLSAVRPGLALYRGAVRVSTRLVEVHRSRGPAGYSGFVAPCHGVILVGYSNGFRAGPCLVNARPSRVLEVGMQSTFVEVTEEDAASGEVVLLGDSLTEQAIASTWNTSPHEALVRLTACGVREYVQ